MLSLTRLKTRKDVEDALACGAALQVIHDRGAHEMYHEMRIPKRGRRSGFRSVYKVQHRQLAAAQKEIGSAINRDFTFPDCVQGFVPKGSTVKNARFHLGQALVMHIDVSNFFGSIDGSKVAQAFQDLGCGPEASAELRLLCTLDDRLVQGSSSSPPLANVVFSPIDRHLLALASVSSATYSRYADDLTFSGNTVPDREQVADALAAGGFEVKWSKFRVQRRGRAQFVTGLSVADARMPRAPKALKRYLRTFLFLAEKSGLEDHLAYLGEESPGPRVAMIDGWISYLYGVERPAAERFGKRWLALLKDTRYRSRVGIGRSSKTQQQVLEEVMERVKKRRAL